jgi:FKBP-type peptidyl-prolyl cis-trans isomerase
MIAARLLVPLAAAALFAAGCGDDKDSGSKNTGTNEATTPASTTTEPAQPKASSGQAPAVANAKDLENKPEIGKPSGDPPTALIKKDLVVGKGPAIKSGQMASVQYVGVSWSTGEQFDASWDRGQPFSFPLGQGQVIQGWDQGVKGMKVGGRRELVIPPELAYGAQSPGPGIGPNETLVFVVDLTRIG